MTAFRYRRLQPTGDYDLSDVSISPKRFMDSGPAAAGAVQNVDAHESTAEYEALLAMLKRRDLMPSDLVFSDGRWQSFSDAPEFYEACEGLIDTRALGQHLRAIIIGAIVMAIGVAFFALKWMAATR